MLCAGLCTLAPAVQTKAPPAGAEIRQQALRTIALPTAWKAGGDAGPIADNWLASFNDPQLDALVKEAIATARICASPPPGSSRLPSMSLSPRPPSSPRSTYSAAAAQEEARRPYRSSRSRVSWEIDLWGRWRYARNAAQEDYASAQSDFGSPTSLSPP
jgi:outer membrane protein TolC